MKNSIRGFRIVLMLIFIASTCFLTTSCGTNEPAGTKDASGRKTISDAERAVAMWEVQNTMSKHAYYHAAGMHLEELEDIWVKEDGEYAATASWGGMQDMQGYAEIKEKYGTQKLEADMEALEQISKIYPEIENIPENRGAGTEWVMHTQTTPIVEIAGDGKTAKGVWYSPGLGLTTRIQGDSVSVGSIFFWEKYGADFVKEDGEWKLWHIAMYYDFTPSLPPSVTAQFNTGGQQGDQAGASGGAPGGQADGPPPGGGRGGGAPGGSAPSSTGEREYQSWSPAVVPMIAPRFPEPYYTFRETFSY